MRDLLTILVGISALLTFPASIGAGEVVMWEHDEPYCESTEECPEASAVTKITATGLSNPAENGVHLIQSAHLDGGVCALTGRTLSPSEISERGVRYAHVPAQWFLDDGKVRPMRWHEYANHVFVTGCFHLQPDQSLEIVTLSSDAS